MNHSPSRSAFAVAAALIANLVLAVVKLAGFAATGSGSLLAEALHSIADSFNQATLAFGLRVSAREANPEHPYGYGRTGWAWAVVSAMGVLFIGAGISVFTGIERLIEPVQVQHFRWAWGALAAALLLEGTSLVVGLTAVRASARRESMGLIEYLRAGSDPLGVAVVMEDGTAVLGVVIAALALAVSWATGDPMFDAIGSIAIGTLLAASATFLVRRNIDLLSGRAPADEMRARILRVIAEDPLVEGLHDVKSIVVGTDKVRFKAEVVFDGAELARRYLSETDLDWENADSATIEDFLVQFADQLVDELGAEIDRIEDAIRAAVPQVEHIDLEVHRPPPPGEEE